MLILIEILFQSIHTYVHADGYDNKKTKSLGCTYK